MNYGMNPYAMQGMPQFGMSSINPNYPNMY